MVKICVLACLLGSASFASAQTIEDRISLHTLNWGHIAIQPIDADGDPTTDEWLVRTLPNGPWRYRVVAVRQQRICVGEWFSPVVLSGFTILAGEVVEKRLGKDKLILTLQPFTRTGETQREVVVIALHIPPCP